MPDEADKARLLRLGRAIADARRRILRLMALVQRQRRYRLNVVLVFNFKG
jgi:hypothetical protein